MDALLTSTLVVTLAEIGDKTQLLALILAARFSQRGLLILGITLATLINHGVSAWFGRWLSSWIPAEWYGWIVGGAFILLGLWLLIPDQDEDVDKGIFKYGAFVAAFVLFFIAEIADKTQVATVALAARFDDLSAVVVGTTVGMLVANIPVIYAGRWLLQKIPLQLVHWLACGVFVVFGVLTIWLA